MAMATIETPFMDARLKCRKKYPTICDSTTDRGGQGRTGPGARELVGLRLAAPLISSLSLSSLLFSIRFLFFAATAAAAAAAAVVVVKPDRLPKATLPLLRQTRPSVRPPSFHSLSGAQSLSPRGTFSDAVDGDI